MLVFLSTGRTGTKFLSKLLSNYISISHQKKKSRKINIVGNICLNSSYPRFLKTYLKSLLINQLTNSSSDPLISIGIIILLNDIKFENIKFIQLIRDPRDFVTSFMNWKNATIKKKILHHFVPFWQPNPWWVGEVPLTKWIMMGKFEHFCWVWNYKNNLFKKAAINYDYKQVKFEDLTNPLVAKNKFHELLNL